MAKNLNLSRHLDSAGRAAATLVLASSSTYRRALLERLAIAFTTASPAIDETPLSGEAPQLTARRLAETKARAVHIEHSAAYVLGSDQVALLDGELLGKPGNRDAALAQLAHVRGRIVVFHTAVCLLETSSGYCQVEEVPTTVQFRNYTDAQAAHYVAIDRPYDCAGSAKIEALGIALVERAESSDPTAIIGLPLIAVVTMLKRVGLEVV